MDAASGLYDESAEDQERSETWRRMLTGSDRSLGRLRRAWHHVPDGPRCKMCSAPFGSIGGVITRVVQHGRSDKNPLLCNFCFAHLREHIGGADIELSVLFADVRGSTGLAERLGPSTFRAHLQRMYRMAHKAVEDQDGIVDKFLGDGVMALFLPLLTGEDHSGRAIRAATDLIRAVESSELPAAGVRVGAGVHSGEAFVGVIGSDERLDFPALGDTVNVAARLGGIAAAGELLVSAVGWDDAPRDLVPDERGPITVQGRTEPLEVVRLRLGAPTETAAA